MQSNLKSSKKDLPNNIYFPVYDIREASDFKIESEDYNLTMLGVQELHSLGVDGTGIAIGIIDSGCDPTNAHTYKNFTKETDRDLNGHGTHVLSLLRAISPLSTFHMAKAMVVTGGGEMPDLQAATLWLIDNGIKLINGSFAFNSDKGMEDYLKIIEYGVSQGVTFVFASGNEGADKVSFPSSAHNVFSVGAVDRFGDITSFSNKGTEIDLVAPGKDIVGDGLKVGTKVVMSGTSQATPHVTGMIALYKQKKGEGDFFKVYSDLTKGSVRDLGNVGFDTSYGYGLIAPYFGGIHLTIPKKTSIFRKIGDFIKGVFS